MCLPVDWYCYVSDGCGLSLTCFLQEFRIMYEIVCGREPI